MALRASVLQRLRDRSRLDAKQIASAFLKKVRRERGLTQEGLAVLVAVTRGYIGQIESLNSDTKAPLEFLVLVARATDIPFSLSEGDLLKPPT